MPQLVSVVLVITGLALELLGVLRMARRYVHIVPPIEIPRLLWGALTGSAGARQAARLYRLFAEDSLDTMQGLGLIALGFVCQTVGTLLTLAWGTSCSAP